MSTAAAADLRVGAGVLKTFKQRVDKILQDFEGSAASSGKVSHQRFGRDAVAGNDTFNEAVEFHTQYDAIHGRITELSKMLSLQIEAMGIAAHGAEIGFGNLEEDQRRRFWEIQTKIDREATAADERREKQQGGGEQAHSGDKNYGGGLS
ncbi:hypothetical protein [Streptomyces sp. VRA16 Mangrove soil]|uniref:hypothetical protein n=1 Tax=Streptomyces sp. VRA16 Mangrove soil TaxID=2817434 RepID=UPI001A9F42E1|nr:hypothetical protein [Streptomyces sp. VRA16 Mangrove soil]MBO1336042.1 hypothetical protein [Streptomyces sp. VRA16 Mangrove soil]